MRPAQHQRRSRDFVIVERINKPFGLFDFAGFFPNNESTVEPGWLEMVQRKVKALGVGEPAVCLIVGIIAVLECLLAKFCGADFRKDHLSHGGTAIIIRLLLVIRNFQIAVPGHWLHSPWGVALA